MIQLTIKDLLDAIPALEALSGVRLDDGVVAFRVAKILRLLNDELADFNVARSNLAERYDLESEEFAAAFNGLLKEEITLPVAKIPVTAFNSVQLTIGDFMRLDFMLEDVDD